MSRKISSIPLEKLKNEKMWQIPIKAAVRKAAVHIAEPG